MPRLADRFWSNVEKTDACWLWRGSMSHNGYGRFFQAEHAKRRRVAAHRWSLGESGVSVPDDMEVDHLCKNRACVRPEHLEVVTKHENILRSDAVAGRNSRKTECLRGHALSGANLYVTPNGRRQCRTCRAATSRAFATARSL